jgi:hypothetical protein
MLERLHPEVRILARQPGATAADVATLQARYPALPRAFAELMREVTELEVAYRGRYLRLYGPAGCVEMDQAYSIAASIPGAITIGDNGGGDAILFLPGAGIVRVGYGALHPDEVEHVAASLEDLLIHANVSPEAVGACQA